MSGGNNRAYTLKQPCNWKLQVRFNVYVVLVPPDMEMG